MSKLMHESITKEILGAAFSVHTFLGNGFPEVIYQRALYHELQDRELLFGREVSMPIFYKNLPKPIGYRRADFVVEDKVIVELKARKALEDTHVAQVLNYLKAYKMRVGLLINFGTVSLEYKRLVR